MRIKKVGMLCLISFIYYMHLFILHGSAAATEIVVVVNKDNPIFSINKNTLKRIFLKKKKYWSKGGQIVPFDMVGTSPERHEFSSRFLKKTPSELKNYWIQQQITKGEMPPNVLISSTMVKMYISKVSGAIGYISKSDLDNSVKMIEVMERGADE